MNTWLIQVKSSVNISRLVTALLSAGLIGVGLLAAIPQTAQAATGINQTINYQGRLLTATGAVVPDGNYNMTFKIYQDGAGAVAGDTGGTLEWTEVDQNTIASGSTAPVVVKNGYFSVTLGALCPLSGSTCQGNTNTGVNFNSDTLWLSTNIAGTAVSNTPTYDGEMLPMKRLAANPYAINSGQLGGLTSGQYVQLGQGIQAATSTTNAAIAINQTGITANILDLQRGGADVQLINNNGQTLFRPTTDSQTALQVQKAGTTTVVFTVDSTNSRIGIGTGAPAYAVDAVGSVNASVSLKVANTDVCTTSGCTASLTSAIRNSGTQQTSATFSIDGNGTAGNFYVLAGGNIDTSTGGALNIGATTATSVNIGKTASNTVTTINGLTVVKPTTGNDSTIALQIQNASGTTLLDADTTAAKLSISTTTGSLNVNGVANPAPPTLATASTTGSLAAATYYYKLAAQGATNAYTTAISSSPTSVTTTGTTSKNTLSWTSVPNATGYIIYRSINGTTWYTNTVTAGTTSLIDNGSTYTWTTSATPNISNYAGGVNLQSGTPLVLDGGIGNALAAVQYFGVNGNNNLDVGNYNTSGAVSISANSFYFQDTAGYNSDLTINNSGQTVFENRVNSPAAFQIQNAGAVSLLAANTSTGAITLGTASSLTGQLAFANGTNAFTSTFQGNTAATASYISVLPAAVGIAGKCLAVSSVVSTTQTLGYASCAGGGGGVTLQGGTPGTPDTGNINVSGTVIAGTQLFSPILDSPSSGGTINIGQTNATGGVTITPPATFSNTATFNESGLSAGVTINYGTGGAANPYALLIQPNGSSNPLVIVDGSASRVTFGSSNGCISLQGRVCINQNAQTGSANVVNLSNVLTIGSITSGGTSYGQRLIVNDTSSQTVIDNGLYINNTGTTNATATVNGIYVNNPTGLAGGDLLQLQGASSDVFTVSNAGVATVTNSSNLQVGTNGTAVGQEYVSGLVPTAALGSVTLNSGATAHAIQGKYAYTAEGSRIEAIDISDPTAPVVVGSLVLGAQADDVAVAGHYAYVTLNSTPGLIDIIDISNPTNLVSAGQYSTGSANVPYDVAIQGHYAYVSLLNGSQIIVLDISNPSVPVQVGAVAATSPTELAVNGHYLYYINIASVTLVSVDISNPAAPTAVSSIATASAASGLYIQGKYAYVTNNGSSSTSKLQIFDISKPGTMTSTGSIATGSSSNIHGVYVQGRYAYITLSTAVGIYDVSTPAAPVNVGSFSIASGTPESISVVGRYEYVATTSKLYVLDVGGAYIQQIEAGGAEFSTLNVDANSAFNGSVSVGGGLVVGQGLTVNGDFGGSGNLNLGAVNTFAETSTCGTSVGNGALYYNSASGAIRGCVNSNWEDVVTTSGLGIILYGVVPDSGSTNPGDLSAAGAAATGASGPCKVSVGTTANKLTWTSCIAYSGGRKVIISAGTATISASTSVYQNLCIFVAGNQPTLGTANATETSAQLPTFSPGSPALCLATILTATVASKVAAIYDTRVFTTDVKVFGAIGATGLGTVVKVNTTAGTFVQAGAAAAAFGVVGIWSGTASTTTPNAVLITGGPIWVRSTTTAGTVGNYLNTAATGTVSNTTASATAYVNVGIAATVYSGVAAGCAVSVPCSGSDFTNIDIK